MTPFYKYKHSLRYNGDMTLQIMAVGEKCPTVADIMASPLAKYTTLSTTDCVYCGTEEEFIVNYIHLLFFKDKSAASQEDNPNWREATTGVFSDNYWKTMKADIAILGSMGAW